MNIYTIRANLIQCAFALREVSHSCISYHSNKWIDCSWEPICHNILSFQPLNMDPWYAMGCQWLISQQSCKILECSNCIYGVMVFIGSQTQNLKEQVITLWTYSQINESAIFLWYIYDLITHFNRRNDMYFGTKTISYIWHFFISISRTLHYTLMAINASQFLRKSGHVIFFVLLSRPWPVTTNV